MKQGAETRNLSAAPLAFLIFHQPRIAIGSSSGRFDLSSCIGRGNVATSPGGHAGSGGFASQMRKFAHLCGRSRQIHPATQLRHSPCDIGATLAIALVSRPGDRRRRGPIGDTCLVQLFRTATRDTQISPTFLLCRPCLDREGDTPSVHWHKASAAIQQNKVARHARFLHVGSSNH